MITNEALQVLVNNLGFTKRANREYDSSFGVEGAKIGATANIRKPVRYIGGDGPGVTLEDITETSVPVVLNHQGNVAMSFTSADLKLRIDEFSRRIIAPAVANIANRIDRDGLLLYQKVYNFVGTPGVVPANLDIYLNAQAALNNNATPMDGQRVVAISPNMEATVVFALRGLFQSSTQIKEQYEKGTMGVAAGFEWFMDQNVASHTVGLVASSTPLVNGANQTGTSIITDGWNASTQVLNVGDIVQFAGIYQVNPQNRQSTGVLQPFVITAPVTSDGSGNATLPISPGIVTAGAYQTVTVSAADNAVITVFGIGTASFSTLSGSVVTQGLAYHPNAFTLACADLPLPGGTDRAVARASDPEVGISIRMIRDYSIMTDQWPCRVDVLYGWAALREETACRILGS
jgi:hypothetical protein